MFKPEDTKQFWDGIAKDTSLSDKGFVGMLTDGNEYNAIYRQREEEQHFMRIFSPTNKMKVLEVGSGGGRWSFFLADKVQSVIGIDFSEQMIALAEHQKQASGVKNVDFVQTDLLAFDSDEKFDLVYFSGVLQYIDDNDVAETLEQAKALLRDGGVIISRDTTQEKRRLVLEKEYPVIYRTIGEYENLFSSRGLKMNYCEMSYPTRRFSTFIAKVYALPMVSYSMAFGLQSILIAINRLLGNPRFLMKKHYREMLDSVGRREHRFFRYVAE